MHSLSGQKFIFGIIKPMFSLVNDFVRLKSLKLPLEVNVFTLLLCLSLIHFERFYLRSQKSKLPSFNCYIRTHRHRIQGIL